MAGASDLTLLAASLHELNLRHPSAVVAFAASGLPTVPSELRAAGITHPDRLFTLEEIPPTLGQDESLYAVIEPGRRVGVSWKPEAAELLVEATEGYPAHLQSFADETWHVAAGPNVITLADARAGRPRLNNACSARASVHD